MTKDEEAQLLGMLTEAIVDPARVKDFVDQVVVKAYAEGLDVGRDYGYDVGYDDGREYAEAKGVTL